jgi:hypothetical protein
MTKIERIINLIRENMMSSSMPTNNISSGNIKNFDPVIGFKKRKNGKVDNRRVRKSWRNWIDSLGM